VQRFVTVALAGKERGTLLRRARQGGVKKVFDPLPALRFHVNPVRENT
jgi:hypothetical protein